MASRERSLFESSSFPPTSPTCYILTRIESLDLSPPSFHLSPQLICPLHGPPPRKLRTDTQRPAFQGGKCVQHGMIGAEATPVKRPGTGVCDATCWTVIQASPEPSRCPPAGLPALPPPRRWLQGATASRHRAGIRPRDPRALVSDPSSSELDGPTPPEVAPAIAEPHPSGRSSDGCPIP
jgi:hypothetical protein